MQITRLSHKVLLEVPAADVIAVLDEDASKHVDDDDLTQREDRIHDSQLEDLLKADGTIVTAVL